MNSSAAAGVDSTTMKKNDHHHHHVGDSTTDPWCGTTVRIPHTMDVVYGRGGLSNNHQGNKMFRELIMAKKDAYESLQDRARKNEIAVEIVQHMRKQGARFLQFSETNQVWFDSGNSKAVEKTKQRFRELRDPRVRNKIANQMIRQQQSKETSAAAVPRKSTQDTIRSSSEQRSARTTTTTAAKGILKEEIRKLQQARAQMQQLLSARVHKEQDRTVGNMQERLARLYTEPRAPQNLKTPEEEREIARLYDTVVRRQVATTTRNEWDMAQEIPATSSLAAVARLLRQEQQEVDPNNHHDTLWLQQQAAPKQQQQPPLLNPSSAALARLLLQQEQNQQQQQARQQQQQSPLSPLSAERFIRLQEEEEKKTTNRDVLWLQQHLQAREQQSLESPPVLAFSRLEDVESSNNAELPLQRDSSFRVGDSNNTATLQQAYLDAALQQQRDEDRSFRGASSGTGHNSKATNDLLRQDMSNTDRGSSSNLRYQQQLLESLQQHRLGDNSTFLGPPEGRHNQSNNLILPQQQQQIMGDGAVAEQLSGSLDPTAAQHLLESLQQRRRDTSFAGGQLSDGLDPNHLLGPLHQQHRRHSDNSPLLESATNHKSAAAATFQQQTVPNGGVRIQDALHDPSNLDNDRQQQQLFESLQQQRQFRGEDFLGTAQQHNSNHLKTMTTPALLQQAAVNDNTNGGIGQLSDALHSVALDGDDRKHQQRHDERKRPAVEVVQVPTAGVSKMSCGGGSGGGSSSCFSSMDASLFSDLSDKLGPGIDKVEHRLSHIPPIQDLEDDKHGPQQQQHQPRSVEVVVERVDVVFNAHTMGRGERMIIGGGGGMSDNDSARSVLTMSDLGTADMFDETCNESATTKSINFKRSDSGRSLMSDFDNSCFDESTIMSQG